MGRRLPATIGTLAASLAFAACGASTPPAGGGGPVTGRGGSDGLVGALASVSDTPISRRYLEWSDVARIAPLAGQPASAAPAPGSTPKTGPRWLGALGIGSGSFATIRAQLYPTTRIDVLAAREAILVGQPPDSAVRLDGDRVDGGAIAAAIAALGAKPANVNGLQVLAFGAERSFDPAGPLASLGVTNQLDRVLADGHVFGGGSTVDSLRAVLGRAGGTMLGSDPSYKAAASCLGDTVWAVVLPGPAVDAGSGSLLVAIGGERPRSASAPVANVMCAVDASDGAAQAHVARLRRALGPQGRLFALGEPVSAVASGVEVDRADAEGRQVARARLTLRATASAAFLYQELRRGELATLIGTTCPSSTPGRTVRPATRRAICRRLGLPPPTR